MRGKASLEGRDEASRCLRGVALGLDKGVLELEGSEGSNNGNNKNVDVGNEDNGALVCDALAHSSAGEGAPLVDVQHLR